MVTARWIKPRVETENIKRKKSNYATLKKKCHQTTKGDSKRGREEQNNSKTERKQ